MATILIQEDFTWCFYFMGVLTLIAAPFFHKATDYSMRVPNTGPFQDKVDKKSVLVPLIHF